MARIRAERAYGGGTFGHSFSLLLDRLGTFTRKGFVYSWNLIYHQMRTDNVGTPRTNDLTLRRTYKRRESGMQHAACEHNESRFTHMRGA